MICNNISKNKKNELSLIKSEEKLGNIKSKYILQKILNDLSKKKMLAILKYNKNIQKRLDININTYKEYVEVLSEIEIEIIPAINKCVKFINFIDEDYEIYYHIYFNDNNKEEIKKNYFNESDQVKKINIKIDHQVKSFYKLFDGCGYIEYINFKKFYRKNINNMRYMFYGCSSLKEINVSNFNTNNVTNMGGMFYRCSSLKNIDISNFNTNNVTDMSLMFNECSSLKKINLSNLNFANVTNMFRMFFGCTSLEEVIFYNFNINNDCDMSCMFLECSDKLQKEIVTKYKFIKKEAFFYGEHDLLMNGDELFEVWNCDIQ